MDQPQQPPQPPQAAAQQQLPPQAGLIICSLPHHLIALVLKQLREPAHLRNALATCRGWGALGGSVDAMVPWLVSNAPDCIARVVCRQRPDTAAWVRALAAAGADPTTPHRSRRISPMQLAAQLADGTVALALVEAGLDWGEMLWSAASEGNASAVTALLASAPRGVDVNAQQQGCGRTLAHAAAKAGKAAAVAALLGAGASVHAVDSSGAAPLHLAREPAVVTALISAGADVCLQDNNGRTALHEVAADGGAVTGGAAVVAQLVGKGGGELLNVRDVSGGTALHAAAAGGNAFAVEALTTNGIRQFLLAVRDHSGRTALHAAAASGSTDVAEALVKAPGGLALLAVRDNDGRTALHVAASSGSQSTNVAEALVRAGGGRALLAVRDDSGRTALHAAAASGNTAVAELVADAGGRALLAVHDNSGERALRSAAGGVRPDCNRWGTLAALLQHHISAGLELDVEESECVGGALCHAAEQGKDAAVRALLAAGAPVGARDLGGSSTALHRAAQGGHPHVVRRLLAAGADVFWQDSLSWTALHEAARVGHVEVCKALLAGARERVGELLAMPSSRSSSALSLAAEAGKWSAVALLASAAERAGLDLVPLLASRYTYARADAGAAAAALREAAARGEVAQVADLLAGGADPNARDGEGRTPIHCLAEQRPPPPLERGRLVMQLLLAAGADLGAVDTSSSGLTVCQALEQYVGSFPAL